MFNNEVLREKLGFRGMIVSDCGAINGIRTNHNYSQNIAQAGPNRRALPERPRSCGAAHTQRDSEAAQNDRESRAESARARETE